MSDRLSQPLRVLTELLRAHGVSVTSDGHWLTLSDHGMRARAELFESADVPEGAATVQLDVSLELWTGCVVVESCGGVGATPEAAAANAWETFAMGSLHALLSAFLHTSDEQVTLEAWEIAGTLRAVTIGQAVIRQYTSESELSTDWFGAVERALRSATIPEGTHWVRVFYGHHNRETVALEVLLDNQPWHELQDLLQDAPWPSSAGFYTLRVFLVLQGGLDVSRGLARIIDLADKPDDVVAESLQGDGVGPDDAQALLAFVPLAFGRELLAGSGVRFADTAMVKVAENPLPFESSLQDEPVFVEATRLARLARTDGSLTQEQFQRVAMRSAEVAAVNKALHAGAKLEDLVGAPPVVTLS